MSEGLKIIHDTLDLFAYGLYGAKKSQAAEAAEKDLYDLDSDSKSYNRPDEARRLRAETPQGVGDKPKN